MNILKPLRVLGVIPARGGSKGIPRKNLVTICGKPLIRYAIDAAKSSSLLDRFVVSTDDSEIAEVARALGASVPFLRPANLSGDNVPDFPVIQHCLEYLKNVESYHPDAVALLRCTTPRKTGRDIDVAIQLLADSGKDSIRSMTPVDGVHHPYWMYVSDGEQIGPLLPGRSAKEYPQRQMLPPVLRLNGVVDVFLTRNLESGETLYGEEIGYLEMPEERSIDIDTPADLQYARILFEQAACTEED